MKSHLWKAISLLCSLPTSMAWAQQTPPLPPKPTMPPVEILASSEALPYKVGKTLYENPLASPGDVTNFRLEGDAAVSFPNGRMRMENQRAASEGQAANFVYWCPQNFPSDIEISWDFWPVREPGLVILFFAAKGRHGEDLFNPALKPRRGDYAQYHSSDINALHVSYFRRGSASERSLNVCNLRKSYGFHLVAQGADPIPGTEQASGPYHVRLTKFGSDVRFFINDLPVLNWHDDGTTYGPLLGGGKIGFRQMAPLVAEYANLKVRELLSR